MSKHFIFMSGGRIYRDKRGSYLFGWFRANIIVCNPFSAAYGGSVNKFKWNSAMSPEPERIRRERA